MYDVTKVTFWGGDGNSKQRRVFTGAVQWAMSCCGEDKARKGNK